jgi:nicotinamide-nucleotide amidase
MLGVPQDLLDRHGAVSAEVAEAMAAGCRVRFRTDLAVSTVGLAGPEEEVGGKPAGLVYAALAWDGGVTSTSSNWVSTRPEVQSRTAKMALNQARLHLMRLA